MTGFTPDTSCMVAAVCGWHEHHDRAAAELTRRLAAREPMLLAGPALVETYAVLTRLPPPHRLSPSDSLGLLEGNFLDAGQIVTLDGGSYRGLLRRAPRDAISGGRVYDTVIAQCALKAKASALLTFNQAHFASFACPGFDIVVP